MSVAYFNDLLKFETGKTLEEYFELKRLDIARHMLLQDGHTPAAVARKLGYPNVQYFSAFSLFFFTLIVFEVSFSQASRLNSFFLLVSALLRLVLASITAAACSVTSAMSNSL